MNVRAKLKCIGLTHIQGLPEGEVCADITLVPVWDNGDTTNQTWSRLTPNGRVTLTITNPDAIEGFELGKSYFVDFSPAEPSEPDLSNYEAGLKDQEPAEEPAQE